VNDPVSFGASEMIMDAMRDGLLDAAVSVCEGVGTVVITRPDLVEMVGAHMTGIVSTSPIPEVRKSLLRRGSFILDKKCTIDQVKGFQRAVKARLGKLIILNRALSMPDQFLVQRANLPRLDHDRQPKPLL
jgi:hypothetical protein